jgi:putative aminopeptidase FrvX
MSKEKLVDILSTPTYCGQEQYLIAKITRYLNESNLDYVIDEHGNIYVTKGKLNEGEFYPMFVAHTDTVHEIIPKINVKEVDVYRPVTFGKIFESVSFKLPYNCIYYSKFNYY